MADVTFADFASQTSPALTDTIVGYRTATTGGEQRVLLSDLLTLIKANLGAITVDSVALGSTTPGIISGTLGAITLTAAGTNQNVTITPSGTGTLFLGVKAGFTNGSLITENGTGALTITTPASQNISFSPGAGGFFVTPNIRSGSGQNLILGTTSFGDSLSFVSATGAPSFNPISTFLSGAIFNSGIAAINTASSGALSLKLGVMTSAPSNSTDSFVGVQNTGGPGSTNGDMLLICRSSAAAGIRFFTGNTTPTLGLLINSSQNAIFSPGGTAALTISGSSGAGTLTGGAGNMTITAGTGNSRTLTLQTTTSGGTATNALVLSATQNATFGGSITTSTPNGGTAGAWKFGIRVAATSVLDTTQYIQVDVGGTLFRLACAA